MGRKPGRSSSELARGSLQLETKATAKLGSFPGRLCTLEHSMHYYQAVPPRQIRPDAPLIPLANKSGLKLMLMGDRRTRRFLKARGISGLGACREIAETSALGHSVSSLLLR